MKYRVGRKVGNTIYVQRGSEPSDKDTFIGSCVSKAEAENLVIRANQGLIAEKAMMDDLSS